MATELRPIKVPLGEVWQYYEPGTTEPEARQEFERKYGYPAQQVGTVKPYAMVAAGPIRGQAQRQARPAMLVGTGPRRAEPEEQNSPVPANADQPRLF